MMMTPRGVSSGMPEAREAGEMKRSALTAVLREEDGVYVSECPELGVATCGDTPEEALVNLKEAVEVYLENAKEPGLDGRGAGVRAEDAPADRRNTLE
ncbi:type II toxin-antitoxin system HicB family antitoxin [Methanofollis liminatans]|nr:type II toxin-antitoxin system HicB family antitoxin [Methanofollis liminatans]